MGGVPFYWESTSGLGSWVIFFFSMKNPKAISRTTSIFFVSADGSSKKAYLHEKTFFSLFQLPEEEFHRTLFILRKGTRQVDGLVVGWVGWLVGGWVERWVWSRWIGRDGRWRPSKNEHFCRRVQLLFSQSSIFVVFYFYFCFGVFGPPPPSPLSLSLTRLVLASAPFGLSVRTKQVGRSEDRGRPVVFQEPCRRSHARVPLHWLLWCASIRAAHAGERGQREG